MKRRSRSWLASRAANASSRRSSIRLSAMPSRPTSVRWSVVSTRCERSPPAIAAAVWPMRSSGSSPTRTTTSAKPPTGRARRRSRCPRRAAAARASGWWRRSGSRRRSSRPVGGGRGQHAVVADARCRRSGLADLDVGGQVGRLAASRPGRGSRSLSTFPERRAARRRCPSGAPPPGGGPPRRGAAVRRCGRRRAGARARTSRRRAARRRGRAGRSAATRT